MRRVTDRLFFFCLIILFTNCNYPQEIDFETKESLVQAIVAKSEKITINGHQKVAIALSGYCDKIDCEEYFKGYEDVITLYSKEDIFMLGVRFGKTITIDNIDVANRTVFIRENKFVRRGTVSKPEVVQIRF